MFESSKPKIITICGDPGGAKAILPVIRKITEGNNELINYAYNESKLILENANINYNLLPEKVDVDFIRTIFQAEKPLLLLTATSFNELNWEKYFILEARKLNIYSMAILDYWSNYFLRFSNEKEKLVYLPDKIAVMDEKAKTDMLDLDFPVDKIVVTGQPAFDSIQADRDNFSMDKKNNIRKSLNIHQNTVFIIFLSQPFKKLYGKKGNPNYLGFDEDLVLENLIKALEKICEKGIKIFLLIRPHPRELESDYDKYKSDKILIRNSKDGEGRDYLMSADLVVGMNSILLVEACYLSCTVVSIQPGLCRPDTLVTNKTKKSIAIFDINEIFPIIENLLVSEKSEKNISPQVSLNQENEKYLKNATNNIIKYLQTQLDVNF